MEGNWKQRKKYPAKYRINNIKQQSRLKWIIRGKKSREKIINQIKKHK